jgi:ABC-type transport system substrate-binding protein
VKVLNVETWQGIQSGPDAKRATSFATGGCFNPDPSAYDDFLGSWNTKQGFWNVANYTPSQVDKLINAGIATTDPAKRFAIYSNLFRRLQTDVPYVGLCVYDSEIALAPKFTYTNFKYWPFNSSPYLLNVKLAA